MYYVVDISEFVSSVTHVIYIMFLILIKEMFSINITYLAVSHDHHLGTYIVASLLVPSESG